MAAPPTTTTIPLFGGPNPWLRSDWTAQDDTLRGGSSASHLTTAADGTTALFCGTLDTTALGGAGFASQRTARERVWDLRGCTGVELVVGGGCHRCVPGMLFTLVLKDAVSPDGDGQDASTVSHETTFTARPHDTVYLPLDRLQRTYRGRARPDAPPLDRAAVRRFSLMVRSYFGAQAGPFELELVSVSAVTRNSRSGG